MVVVHAHGPITQAAPERVPAVQAVVERGGDAASIGQFHPGMQLDPQRLRVLLAMCQPGLHGHLSCLAFDMGDPRDVLYSLRCHGARAGLDQFVELATRVRQAAGLDAALAPEDDVIAPVIVTGECGRPLGQEVHRILRSPAGTKVVDDTQYAIVLRIFMGSL